MDKITTLEIEERLAHWFNPRQNLIVPNISWGFGIHECDLLVVMKSGWATEVEIKISKGDLINDLNKVHEHKSNKIRKLYFAIPDYLYKDEVVQYIPMRAGIIVLTKWKGRAYWDKGINVSIERQPQINKLARKIDSSEFYDIARLGCLRLWSLKHQLVCRLNDIDNLKNGLKINFDKDKINTDM